MIRRLLAVLDAYGTDWPAFREGHPEDRCPVCGEAVSSHVGIALPDAEWAKWAHRRAAVVALILR
ncbi:hypothetical protein SEA_PAITO_26 [Mycobacterium phage Paito]|uniref:Uncharacterized protein n=1 Tax=Mycobacterium phage Paito TaxID=2315544 RepID=A0A386KJK4_9CAUD|nr:hypothetical protein KDW68_gp26 [Mycobacterium phage Paito]AYD84611.1 hypothetical protein SEA_PAITO_26 [Mycobacterium phage Paito]